VVPRRLILASVAAALPALASAASLDASIGRQLFERNWVAAPSSTKSNDGLGPLYDATSCASCHTRNANAEIDDMYVAPGTIIRLGNAKGDGDPVYGRQLQTRGVGGQTPEATPDISWTRAGTRRVASVRLFSQGYGELASDTRFALRRSPSLVGIGVLGQISDEEIVKRADPDDADGDGISGRAAMLIIGGKSRVGRFGWKATQPDLSAQTAMAFYNDMGMSTDAHREAWGECTIAQRACREAPHGAEDGIEIPTSLVKLIVEHLESLQPRVRTNTAQADAARGEATFNRAGCALCHAALALPNGTRLKAYTDMLLHDMGPGLNDGIAEGGARPGEWRTAPLWNVATDVKTTGLLHDGRARSVAEAISWHDGEAARARMRFDGLTLAEKSALIAFVSGL
jgi:CxxC motif-containing protein (DUF1111 family)